MHFLQQLSSRCCKLRLITIAQLISRVQMPHEGFCLLLHIQICKSYHIFSNPERWTLQFLLHGLPVMMICADHIWSKKKCFSIALG